MRGRAIQTVVPASVLFGVFGGMGQVPKLVSRVRAMRPYGGPFSLAEAVLAIIRYRLLVRQLSRPSCLRFLRLLFGFWRALTPVVRLGPVVVTLTHRHTKALLDQQDDFIVANGLADRMPAGPFLMNIDWAGRHADEKRITEIGLGADYRGAGLPGDAPELCALRRLVRRKCAQRLPVAGSGHTLNVARDFTEELTLDVAHHYFGIGDNNACDRERLRFIFRLLASQIFQSPPAHSDLAHATVRAQDDLLTIAKRSLGRGGDTVLGRFEAEIGHHAHPWLTEAWAARNAAALAAFGAGTVARAGTQIIFRLMEERGAAEIARREVAAYWAAGRRDDPSHRPDRVLLTAMEALRFNPMLPLIGVRRAARNTALAGQCPHQTARLRAGQTVIPAPFAAMFDRTAFTAPSMFRLAGRDLDSYLHFGGGRHICVGRRAAEVQLEEIVIAIFRRDGAQPFRKGERIKYDGPAVERYRVRFDD